jgi:putative hydrolase of the HAD superfamily
MEDCLSPDPPAIRRPLEPLHAAEAWVFDLDNTLYSSTIDLFAQIDVRMRAYIAAYLGLDLDAAFGLQKRYFHEYGTSLRGLMDRHGMDPRPFLEHVHDIDVSVLEPDPALDRELAKLPGRKLIFTNASTDHAERVLGQLGIGRHFEAIFDIFAADFHPKPTPRIYDRLIDHCRLDPARTVMVEDMARNLAPAAALGMTTVWIRNTTDHGVIGADGDYIDHVIDDLAAWLETITAPLSVGRSAITPPR